MNEFIEFVRDYGWYVAVPLVFIAIVAWVYRPGAKKSYAADGNIPFEEDRKNGTSGPPPA